MLTFGEERKRVRSECARQNTGDGLRRGRAQAMLITKFNKLIRSKIMWGSIGFAMALTFVGSSVVDEMGDDGNSRAKAGQEGALFGEKVDRDAFFQAQLFERGLRPLKDTSTAFLTELRQRTWTRLATLHAAAEMGIEATDEEVRETLARDPSFGNNGVFDPNRYRAVLERELQILPATFEEFVKQDLILRKLANTLQSVVWTSPYELESRLVRLTDRVAVAYALVPPPPVQSTVVSEEDAKAYFEQRTNTFHIPEQRRIRYLAFPISNYLASANVTEAAITNWYDSRISDYVTFDTNNVEKTTPLADVRDEIEGKLRAELAQFDARDAATALVMSMAPDRYGRALTFEEATASNRLSIQTSEWFSAEETIPGLDPDPALTRAAMTLVANDPERAFSDPIVTSNTVYVLAAQDRQEARAATFEDVREEVLAAAQREANDKQREDYVNSFRLKMQESLKDTNTTFLVSAEALGMAVHTTGVFTVYEGPGEELTNGQALVAAILDVDVGQVSEPFELGDDEAVASVLTRMPGDIADVDMVRPQFIRTLDQYRAAALFEAWRQDLMAQAKLEDYHPIVASERDSEW